MRRLLLCSALFLNACSYQGVTGKGKEGDIAISVPRIIGDTEGQLNNALVRALSHCGKFSVVKDEGEYQLKVSLSQDNADRVGFQYDRDAVSGELRKNLIGTENRRTIVATVELVSTVTQRTIFGPENIEADVVYDYVDSDNLYDISFFPTPGVRTTVLDFSLGQLDTIEGAQDASSKEIYHKLAEKIVAGMISHQW